MRNLFGLAVLAILGLSFVSRHAFSPVRAASNPQQSTQSASQQPAPPQPWQQQQPAPPPPLPVRAGPVVVLDPAHGGTDSGARGQAGAIEKDVVLYYARVARVELERQGLRAVLTRDDDSNLSYDDRASLANSYRDAVFITLHVASTGAFGTARVYYYRFASSPSGPPAPPEDATAAPSRVKNAPAAPVPSLVPWNEAQRPHLETSHHLADVLQDELAQRFGGSPTIAAAVAVRGLRSVDAPAVAIELSSVSVQDPAALDAMAAPLAASIVRGLQAYKAGLAGGN